MRIIEHRTRLSRHHNEWFHACIIMEAPPLFQPLLVAKNCLWSPEQPTSVPFLEKLFREQGKAIVALGA
jgi:hypothetical protein